MEARGAPAGEPHLTDARLLHLLEEAQADPRDLAHVEGCTACRERLSLLAIAQGWAIEGDPIHLPHADRAAPERFTARLLGELPAGEAAEVDAWLASCPSCRLLARRARSELLLLGANGVASGPPLGARIAGVDEARGPAGARSAFPGAREPGPGALPARRTADPELAPRRPWWSPRLWIPSVALAALALVVSLWPVDPSRDEVEKAGGDPGVPPALAQAAVTLIDVTEGEPRILGAIPQGSHPVVALPPGSKVQIALEGRPPGPGIWWLTLALVGEGGRLQSIDGPPGPIHLIEAPGPAPGVMRRMVLEAPFVAPGGQGIHRLHVVVTDAPLDAQALSEAAAGLDPDRAPTWHQALLRGPERSGLEGSVLVELGQGEDQGP